MSKSKSAPAHKFVVVSPKPWFTYYDGTKDQLLSLGVALDHDFPDKGKRVKRQMVPVPYKGDDIEIRRLKGGLFRVTRWHQARESIKSPVFNFKVPLAKNEGGYIQWSLYGGGNDLPEELSRTHSYQDLAKAASLIAATVEHEIYQYKRSRLKLVEPMTATGGGR